MAGMQAQPKWEYMTVPETERDRLSALGAEGWEMVAIGDNGPGSMFYFKRRLPDFRELVTLDQQSAYYASRGLEPSNQAQTPK